MTIDEESLQGYFDAPTFAIKGLLKAWGSGFPMDISEVVISHIPTELERLDRWQQLCRTLGSNSNLRSLRVACTRGDTRFLAVVLQNMRQISNLALYRGRVPPGATDIGYGAMAHALHPSDSDAARICAPSHFLSFCHASLAEHQDATNNLLVV